MDKEEWKDIPNYEGIYEASTHGRIRTKEGKVTHSVRHGVRHWKSRILKGRGNFYKTGSRVSLWKDKQCKDWLVARLVVITFLGYIDDEMTVNHKDLNRLNNHIDNLEWLTNGDNIRHGFENGAFPQKKIRLIHNDTSEHLFRSLVQASKWLGRNDYYVSCQINRGQDIRDIHGDAYKYELYKGKTNKGWG